MKRVKQGSLSAVLDNGIHLSYSFYGPTGEYLGITLKTHTIFSLCEAPDIRIILFGVNKVKNVLTVQVVLTVHVW